MMPALPMGTAILRVSSPDCSTGAAPSATSWETPEPARASTVRVVAVTLPGRRVVGPDRGRWGGGVDHLRAGVGSGDGDRGWDGAIRHFARAGIRSFRRAATGYEQSEQ